MANVPGILDHLVPEDPIIAGAWVSALFWGIEEPDVLAAFRQATGFIYEPAGNPLDQAVDRATGADAAFVLAFAEWFTAHVWGDMGGEHD